MRSQALLRRSRYLFKHSNVQPSSYRLIHLSPKCLSTSSTPPLDPEDPSTTSSNDGPDEKPKIRRTRVSVTVSKDSDTLQLPEGLDILWTPGTVQTDSTILPPPENFEDALNNLLISLHPQTQHRAAYPSPFGAPIEPTLALYCPIEGGDYIIDATVRELAHRAGAEVLVLDAVQLAAGEWGQFGSAASALSLPRNPLHFPSSTIPPTPSTSRPPFTDEDDESGAPLQLFPTPPKMTLTLMTPPIVQGRTILTPSSRRSPPPSKVKVFFDTLVNAPSKPEALATPAISNRIRPRLIYIRDFPTLASSSSSWYPPLLSAVRERRRGPISRPSSPVSCPITIIFGMTPSLTPPAPSNSPSSGLINLLMNRSSATQLAAEPKAGKLDWGENDLAEKARERRLRDRLKKWEKSEAALLEELPKLSVSQEGDESDERPDIIVIGPNGLPGFPSTTGSSSSASGNGQIGSPSDSFFRTSILVPRQRSISEERAARMARRREINELTIRMGVGAAGGIIQQGNAAPVQSSHSPAEKDGEGDGTSTMPQENRMWEEWGNKVEVWSNVLRIADRAVGNTLTTARVSDSLEKTTLDSTIVPWSSVHKAWIAHQLVKDLRTSWLKEAFSANKAIREDEAVEDLTGEQEKPDEVIERVKNEGELDTHEQRLLPCIVDSASMQTSFDQVHLPPHTIDSVRTIVSLPLLHPQAFQQGILKDHGITGCLLFGPPGTGKTLVVRALAKEAGCRMMAISPSDVMDMYVGEGEKLVKAVFSLARRLSPCVIFLDEIDALFGARMSARESGGAFAHRGVITEFMQEMDGLKSSKEDRIIVIGATNRPFDLDDAVLRRLPRRLLVDLPGEKEREEILKILLRNEKLAADLNIHTLAKQTETFSGSDLKHLCVSAALDAVKENIHLPWPTIPVPPDSMASSTLSGETPSISNSTDPVVDSHVRVLHLHNFIKALKEITPSSSEALGSLAELRKWNDEFGEGQRDRKRRQFWGKGRFGFTDDRNKEGSGRVVSEHSDSNPG